MILSPDTCRSPFHHPCLANLNTRRACFSRIPLVSFHQPTSKHRPVMMKFEMQKLVVSTPDSMELEDVDDDSAEEQSAKKQVRCVLCGAPFQSPPLRSSVQRHFTDQHGYNFAPERGPKRISESSPVSARAKVRKCDALKIGFNDAEEYIRNCVILHVTGNLSYEFWNLPAARKIHEPFEKYFNVSVKGRKMREHLSNVHDNLSDKFRSLLRGRPFSIKFDIASRQRRSFLGISIQYGKNKRTP